MSSTETKQIASENTLFVEQAPKIFNKDGKNRKGWDAPTIADLDQDGFADILINDHGYGLRVMWNNQGKFAFPYDILMGDLHGVSVGDIDFDGQLDIIISRGGGSGSNARNAKIYSVDKQRQFKAWPDFKEPLALMRGRTVKFVDLDNDGDLDLLNFAFPSNSKESVKKTENYIYQNNGKGLLTLRSTIPMVHGDGQKTLVTDFNQDSHPDILIYGHGEVKAYQGNGDFTFTDVSKTILPFAINNVTAIAELDYDNDGDFDLIFTRGVEFEKGETFYNEQTKLLGFYTKRGAFRFDDLEIGDTLKIENYQAPWPETLPYIAEPGYKLSYQGETHSGRTINLISSDSFGFPDNITDKKGAFIGYVGNKKWRISGNMFSPFSGVIHNVKSYPKSAHREGLTDLLMENKNGKFIDISTNVGLVDNHHSTGAIVADIDNNGFSDLVIMRRGNLIQANSALVYLNQLSETDKRQFLKVAHHGVISPELGASGLSGEVIDYDLDGRLDLITGNERGQWHLFKNRQDNQNNFLKVTLPITMQNNTSTLGALVKVEACGNTQQKRVGSSGASYATSYDLNLHFGLGLCEKVESVTITWSNNHTSKYSEIKINKTLIVDS
ncbi:CRTAC1 family protein [Thalassomonas sp. M1454]|uniref:CRTAC1 family protein n=1 Tax=Thalassomonas sp. M1454 TaxID=2594477 RepID=UPI00117FC868|nr:CRTAC1 family protein [Thalassomonas sp. M1454]TRX58002.1 CRTAC1 family protein [Thalassomonas sp. M1454]